jgi:hypothetical protein
MQSTSTTSDIQDFRLQPAVPFLRSSLPLESVQQSAPVQQQAQVQQSAPKITESDKSLILQINDSEGKKINIEFTNEFIKICLMYVLIIMFIMVFITSITSIQYYESISLLCADFKNEIKYIYICAIVNIILIFIFSILLLTLIYDNIKTSISAMVYILITLIIVITFLNSFINYKYNVYLGFCSTNIQTSESDYIYLYYYNLVSYTLGFPLCVFILMLLYIYLNKLKKN